MKTRKQIKAINEKYEHAIEHHQRVIALLHERWDAELREVRDNCVHKDDCGFMVGFCKKCGEILE